jgi:hypothetical protein
MRIVFAFNCPLVSFQPPFEVVVKCIHRKRQDVDLCTVSLCAVRESDFRSYTPLFSRRGPDRISLLSKLPRLRGSKRRMMIPGILEIQAGLLPPTLHDPANRQQLSPPACQSEPASRSSTYCVRESSEQERDQVVQSLSERDEVGEGGFTLLAEGERR